ncbi:MAG: response regulator transcription factor [Geminicoccaceae bacterium]
MSSPPRSERQRPRILVVDDEADLRALLNDYLVPRGMQVRQAGDGRAMHAILGSEAIDLVVLDVTMPGENGFELLAGLRAAGNEVPVVMLTSRDGLDDRLSGLSRGADDYVTKPFDPPELMARIRAVLRRVPAGTRPGPARQAEAAAAMRLGRCLFEPASGRLTLVEGDEVPLTALELEVLRAMARHPNLPLSRRQLDELAWGTSGGSGARGLDALMLRLRRKIEVDPEHPAVLRTVRGEGYLLEVGPAA